MQELWKSSTISFTSFYRQIRAKHKPPLNLSHWNPHEKMAWHLRVVSTGIKRWVNIIYTNIESAVQNNGFKTSWFKPSKGVRQGCPLSPYLFILSAEVLSNKIRQESNVRGIKVFGKKSSCLNLLYTVIESLERALKIVGDFGRIAGLSLNVKKKKALWLGKWKNNRNKPLDLKWFHSPVKILRIHFSYNIKANNELNFDKKIQKLQIKLDMWSSDGIWQYLEEPC